VTVNARARHFSTADQRDLKPRSGFVRKEPIDPTAGKTIDKEKA
jgi:hypothetical protein